MYLPSKSNSIKGIFGNILDCTLLYHFFYHRRPRFVRSPESLDIWENFPAHTSDLSSLVWPLFPEPLRFETSASPSGCMTNVAGYWEKGWQQRSCKIEKLKMKTAPWYIFDEVVGCVVNNMTLRSPTLLHISSWTVISDLYPTARTNVWSSNSICMQPMYCTDLVSSEPHRPTRPCQ